MSTFKKTSKTSLSSLETETYANNGVSNHDSYLALDSHSNHGHSQAVVPINCVRTNIAGGTGAMQDDVEKNAIYMRYEMETRYE